MNTSVTPISTPSSFAATAKGLQSDALTSEAPFKQILTREVAERNSADNGKLAPSKEVNHAKKPAENNTADMNTTETNKKDTNAQATSASSENLDKTEVDTLSEVGDISSADQLLLVAAQFSPVAAGSATPASASTANDVPKGTPAVSEPVLKTIETYSSLAVTNPETTDTPVNNPLSFDASLRALNEKGQENEISKHTVQPVTSDVLLPKTQATEKLAELSSMAASINSAIDNAQDVRADLTANMAPLQQAMANRAESFGQAMEKIAPHVGTPAWNQSVGQKLVWMVGNEQQSASLTLNPPDLGPLQVVLSISSTQANASFYAAQPEVRQALEAALPKLREMLADAGIQLGQADVSAGSPQQQSSHSERMQYAHGHDNVGDVSISAIPATTSSTRIVREGIIDIFA